MPKFDIVSIEKIPIWPDSFSQNGRKNPGVGSAAQTGRWTVKLKTGWQ